MDTIKFCLIIFLLKMAAGDEMIWSKQRFALNYTKTLSLIVRSAVRCVGACRMLGLESCSAVHVASVDACAANECDFQCDILAGSESGSGFYAANGSVVYEFGKCAYKSDPCDPNPCEGNSSSCVIIDRIPDCYARSFQCICEHRRTGANCERCSSNYTGPQCQTDVSDSLLVDGIYFYIPYGIDVDGKDMDPDIRPNCSESRNRCAQRGMTLLSIKSDEKNATVSKLQLHRNGCLFCFYQLNLRRSNAAADAADDGVWFWAENSSDVLKPDDFQGWYYGQPDGGPAEPYAAFSPVVGYTWSDVSCTFPAYYVCEYDTQLVL